jgi:hypothetical protein
MVERFFVGDKVRTKLGVGRVIRTRTWRDVISEFENDFEAEEFCSKCKIEVGPDFRSKWVKVWVNLNGVSIPFQARDIELLEARYVDPEVGLGKRLIKKGKKESGGVRLDSGEGGKKETTKEEGKEGKR